MEQTVKKQFHLYSQLDFIKGKEIPFQEVVLKYPQEVK